MILCANKNLGSGNSFCQAHLVSSITRRMAKVVASNENTFKRDSTTLCWLAVKPQCSSKM